MTASKEAIWTPANIVTLLRICGIPVFVVAIIAPWPEWMFPNSYEAGSWRPWVAAGIFILLACTDAIDGYLARSRNEVTNFGKLVDPLADKLLVAAALIALVELRVLPSWVVLIILSREFIVSGVRMIAASQGTVIAASWYGKAKTVSQIIAIVLFILKDSLIPVGSEYYVAFYCFCWLVMIVALALTIISMLDYLSKARHLFGFEPKKSKKELDRYNKAIESGDLSVLSIERQDILNEAERVIESAKAKGYTLSTAESLTGGLISSILTAIPGSSVVYCGSIVSYSNEVKSALLDVSSESLASEGPVTESTVLAMAQGALNRFDTDFAIATSGIAGPKGAEEGKPVGTVWICVAGKGTTIAKCFHFAGDRQDVRMHTVSAGFYMLLEAISRS